MKIEHLSEIGGVSVSPTPSSTESYLTAGEAAALIGVRPSTLAAWRCLKSVGPPFAKFGSAVRYRRSHLLSWAASCERTSTCQVKTPGDGGDR